MKNLLLPFIFLLLILPKLMYGQSLTCAENVHISLNEVGNVNVIPDYFLEGDVPDGTQLSIDGENYFDHIEMDCDIKSFEYIVKTPDGNQCWGMCVIEDRVAPVIDALSILAVVVDAGDEVVITPEMIDLQSYDNCGIVNMKVVPNSFFVYSDMETTVKFSIEDDAGNITQSDILVQVAVNQIDCELENVTNPLSEITIHNYTGNPSDMTPEVLVTDYGYVVGQVEPTFGDCNFGKGYSDVVVLNDTSSLFVINRTWYVVDWSTQDTLHFNQVLTNEFECTINDISVPSDIVLDAVDVQAVDLTPDKLVELGYEKSETRPINSAGCETYISITYNDQVFNENGYTIHREWTIYHWLTGEVRKEIQFIRNLDANFKNSIICDILPRSADVGDCASGHTLDDSVEWPNDITISDYRIKPTELEAYSNIQHEDSQPIFYKNQDDLVSTYYDKFVEITSTQIKLKRIWKVTSKQYGYEWEYEQGLIINYTQGLITVNTPDFRPIPGVKINNVVTTDKNGRAVLISDINSVSLDDKPLNGINVLDLVLMRAYIQGKIKLSKNQLNAADLTADETVSGSDIYVLIQNLLGVNYNLDWFFQENIQYFPIAIRPQAAYIGMKKGDIDGSVLLGDEELPSPTNELVIDDKLLNKGGIYSIPISLDHTMITKGVELRLNVNTDLIEIEDITSDVKNLSWNVTDNGELVVLIMDSNKSFSVEKEFVTLKLKALRNTLLNSAIDTNTSSFSATDDYKLEVLSARLSERIALDILNPALKGLRIYPNPASNILHVDVSKVDLSGNLSVMILNTNGQEVLMQDDTPNIDISSLPNGMYFYQITYAGYTYIDKLIVSK